MQSQFGDAFNHDPWADVYDADVANEQNPVRDGYAATLAWTIAQAAIKPTDWVVDLGAGTGNTALQIGVAGRIICVDLSARMLGLARAKLADRPNVEYVQADLLGFFTADPPMIEPVDVVVSTFAVHHLVQQEKEALLLAMSRRLRPGGRAVFGDLMVADAAAHASLSAHYQAAGEDDAVGALEEEFLWDLAATRAFLPRTGLQVDAVAQLGPLCWGIALHKGTASAG